MILLNLALAGGFLAAAAPVVVHLLHRRRIRQVDWGAMRFLREMMAKSRRRLMFEHLLLMAVRILAVALLALAFTRPALEPEAAAGERIVRHGRTAAVIAIDDSLSAASGRSETRLDRLKGLAQTYIDSLTEGDEVSVLTLSALGRSGDEPVHDLALAQDLVARVEPGNRAGDVPGLLAAAVDQVARHLNPNVEIVLCTDGQEADWQGNDRGRWSELQRRLRLTEDAVVGTRARPRLLVLTPPPRPDEHDLAVTGIRVDRAFVGARRPQAIRVAVRHRGEEIIAGVRLRLAADGETVDERPLALDAGASDELLFEHTFAAAGSHVIEARLIGTRDALSANDVRHHALQVVADLPVLLVEGQPGRGLDGSLGFASLALDPLADSDADGERPRLFAVDRVGLADLPSRDLSDYRVVVLGDVAALDNDTIAAVEGFVVAGGGVFVALGPETDREHVDRFWARRGDGFLACPLGEAIEHGPGLAAAVAAAEHPALAAFTHLDGRVWTDGLIRRYHGLERDLVPGRELAVLLRLANGDPLLVARRRGLGMSALLTTSLDLAWTDLPAIAAYVPLVRGLVADLGAQVLPPRNLRPGEVLSHAARAVDADLVATGPDGQALELAPDTWHGRAVFASGPVEAAGVYTVVDGDESVHYAVAAPGIESEAGRLADGQRERLLAGLEARIFAEKDRLENALAGAERRHTEIWAWVLLAAIAVLFLEQWLAGRQTARERP